MIVLHYTAVVDVFVPSVVDFSLYVGAVVSPTNRLHVDVRITDAKT